MYGYYCQAQTECNQQPVRKQKNVQVLYKRWVLQHIKPREIYQHEHQLIHTGVRYCIINIPSVHCGTLCSPMAFTYSFTSEQRFTVLKLVIANWHLHLHYNYKDRCTHTHTHIIMYICSMHTIHKHICNPLIDHY